MRDNWRNWTLKQKIDYVKGSYGEFNLNREDIASLPDDYREMKYELRVIRMAVNVIEELCK